jgi:hypothetical protein
MLADETTKQYKIEQKEAGIKKETDAILHKAKQEALKIEATKARLRQSILGGVISNNLTAMAQRLQQQRQAVLVMDVKQDNTMRVLEAKSEEVHPDRTPEKESFHELPSSSV